MCSVESVLVGVGGKSPPLVGEAPVSVGPVVHAGGAETVVFGVQSEMLLHSAATCTFRYVQTWQKSALVSTCEEMLGLYVVFGRAV